MDEMTLDQLRAARGFTQAELARLLNTTQAAVSKLEFRTDSYVSSARKFIEATGGRLEIHAIFPDRAAVRIRGLDGDDVLTTAAALVNQMCRINPLVPAHQYNEFLVRSIDDDREIVLEKTSCNNLVHIPLRRISEILPPSGSGKLPTLVLNGRVQWFEGDQRWRFVD
jgi:transcriptional regulator with XRE-family HTH domain